ncbi:MAG TPA: chemotaxis response regulator protein-glutamate methylesterase [Myxococcota bacterium]
MQKARVLVVDDSAVIRLVLSDVLAAEPDIEVAGTAASGELALRRIEELAPTVVTLDVEMPGLGGLATLVEIRRRWPTLPVIMFSALTERAAKTTIDALARGATECIAKPRESDRASSTAYVKAQLLPLVRALSGVQPAVAPAAPTTTRAAAPARLRSSSRPPPEILAFGASTGGPAALTAILTDLPTSFPLPIVVVQHMPPIFTRLFAERLTAVTSIPFSEAVDGEKLLPGHGYVAPGDYHMRIAAGRRIALDQRPHEHSCRPAVDVLFRSVANAYGAAAFGVVLTGMGQDGVLGAEAIVQLGGRVIAQDELSSVVWGMPGYVARAGLADAVLPLAEIADDIQRHCGAAAGGRPHVA